MQAGKTEIIDNFKSRHQKVSDKEEMCVKEENVSFTNTNQRSGRKRKINNGMPSSFCPKMEPVSDIPCSSNRYLSGQQQMKIKQDLDDTDVSEESFEGPSTESSGDERESVDMESDQDSQVKLGGKLKVLSHSDSCGRNSSKSGISDSIPCDTTRTKSLHSRKHRAPDLSILDEIFS